MENTQDRDKGVRGTRKGCKGVKKEGQREEECKDEEIEEQADKQWHVILYVRKS